MASNNVIHLTCDSKNRIWLGTNDGITWMDENRKFHRVILTGYGFEIRQQDHYGYKGLWSCFIPPSLGQFYYNETTKKLGSAGLDT